MLSLFLFAAAGVGAATTDWGPLQSAAQEYAMCAHTAATPYVRSSKSPESVADAAVLACADKAELMHAAIRNIFEPLAPSKA